jgi:hypothetical protein
MKPIRTIAWIIAAVLLLAAGDAAARRPSRRARKNAPQPQDNFDLDKELAKPRFRFEMGERRDPFGDPRRLDPKFVKEMTDLPEEAYAKISADGQTVAGRFADTVTPEQAARERQNLKVASIKLKEAEEAVEARRFERGVEKLAEAEKLLEKEPGDRELATEYKQLQAAAKTLAEKTREHRVKLVCRQLDERMDETKRLFDLGEYDEVLQRCEAVQGEKRPVEAEAIGEKLLAFADLKNRAKVRREFAQHNVVVQGVSIGHVRPVTLMNGQTVRVGDPLPLPSSGKSKTPATDVLEDAVVKTIKPYSVVVDYKGEPIELFVNE